MSTGLQANSNNEASAVIDVPLSGLNKPQRRTYIQQHLNKLRWIVLSLVFFILMLLPALHVYQTYAASHAYDLLTPGEKIFYDTVEQTLSPFSSDLAKDLDNIKGTTWSGTLLGIKLSDPLAAVSQSATGKSFYWPFILTALLPVLATLILGRFFCGWICPATLIYELNDNLSTWAKRYGFPATNRRFDTRIKYIVLTMGIAISAITGISLFTIIYPPALIGRELFYAIAASGFSAGMLFFAATLLFDSLVARRGFCRYLCPGGALYALLGRYRLVRIERNTANCNDCKKCNAACQFGLDPMHDNFGQDCNNCSACISECQTDALTFTIKLADQTYQGPGLLGRTYRSQQPEPIKSGQPL